MATNIQPIGFLSSVGGNRNGIGENYVKKLDAAGRPSVTFTNDDFGGISDAIALINDGSQVSHNCVFRVVKTGDEFYAVPKYDLSPKDAAIDYKNRIQPELPKEVKDNRQHIWILLGNELDDNRADWLGWWSHESALLWNKEGYKVGMVGWNSGEPEAEAWKTPGQVKYLTYCSQHPDLAAVNVHEYSFIVDDIVDGYPYKVGRFQFLFKACDELGIPRVPVLIGEWGWTLNNVPDRDQARREIRDVANLYSQFPQILGAGIWYLGEYQNIANKAQKLIEPVGEDAAGYVSRSFSRELIIDPKDGVIEPPVVEDPGSDEGKSEEPSGMTEVDRQIIEWTPESGVDAVRVIMSRRQGNQWVAHTTLTESLDANSRVEFVLLSEGVEVTKPGERVLGIDISYAQGKEVDFQKMAEAGVRYCFIRAGSGQREKDQNFEHNYAEAGKAGMLRGIYYYLYPENKATVGEASDRTPEGQARRFAALLKEDAELGAVLDVEQKGLTPEEVKRFVDEFQKHDPYDRPITIYTATWFWNKAGGYSGSAVEWAAGHQLWVAQYTSNDEPIKPSNKFKVAIPRPWKKFTIHQWTSVGGPLVGHGKKGLDLNYYAGSLADLQEWARTGVVAPPPKEVIVGTKVVTVDLGLNMRTGPSTAHNVITMLKKGVVVEVMEEGEWDFIRVGGFTGYVSSQFLSILASARDKPKEEERELPQEEPGEFRFVFWPTDVKHVNQHFGERPEFYKEVSDGYLPAHEGIDLAAPFSTPYYCVAPGMVKRVSDKNRHGKPSSYGWHVLVDHGNDYSTLYAHATPEIRVTEGDRVSAGQILAYSGSTGNSSGPHLHLTLKKEGYELAGWPAGYMDPWPFLEPLYNNLRPPMGNLIEGYLYARSLDIRGDQMALAKLNLNLRERPDSNSRLLAKVPEGSPVRLLSAAPENGYYYCETGIDVDGQPKKVREAPKTEKIDLLTYIKGDGRGRSYVVKNDWGSQERFQIQEDGLTFYLLKNTQWEQFLYDEDFIYRDVDTSPGSGRYYRLKDPDRQRGSRWLRRRMAVGEIYTQSRRVQFYKKDNGAPSAPNSGHVTDTIKLAAYHKKYKFQTGVELDDVLELHWVHGREDHTPKEKYFYTRGLGMVGWARGHEDPNSPSWSAVAEIHEPGSRDPFIRERVTIL